MQPGDPLALRQAIERLLADPDLLSRMGQAALRKFSEFHVSALVPRFEQVYQDVLQQKAKPPQRIGLRGDSVDAG